MAKMLNAIPTRNEKLVKWVNEWGRGQVLHNLIVIPSINAHQQT